MKPAIVALLLVGAALLLFGWWGISTVRGRTIFDEMAGMIPLATGALGALLIVVAGTWAIVARNR